MTLLDACLVPLYKRCRCASWSISCRTYFPRWNSGAPKCWDSDSQASRVLTPRSSFVVVFADSNFSVSSLQISHHAFTDMAHQDLAQHGLGTVWPHRVLLGRTEKLLSSHPCSKGTGVGVGMCPESWRRYVDLRVCPELHKGNGAVLRLLQVVKLGRHDGVVPSSSCLSLRAPVAAAEHARVRVRRVDTRACNLVSF